MTATIPRAWPPVNGHDLSLDADSRELRHGQRRIPLPGQPFDVLHMLLERPGQVVTREALHQRLWPAGTFVDYEHSLNAAIARLRRVLGDDAVQPRFIETVPRRGYRFVAPIAGAAVTSRRSAPSSGSRRRLAILPLTGAGPLGEFSEGLTEELIVQVGRVSAGAVAVIARSSSMLFKGDTRRASDIGEALRVDYLLEGSVRGDADRVRIAAWLVETQGETHVWSDTVECRLDTPLAAQVEAASRLAQSLDAMLRPGDRVSSSGR